MKTAIIAAIAAISLFSFFAAPRAEAAAINIWKGAICGGTAPITADQGPPEACDLCDIFVVMRNVIDLLIQLSFALGTLMTVLGAIKMITGGGNPGAVSEAKQKIKSAVTGIAIAVCAWMIVNFIFAVMLPSGAKWNWSKIECPTKQLYNTTPNKK